jgi:hypothetical protein
MGGRMMAVGLPIDKGDIVCLNEEAWLGLLAFYNIFQTFINFKITGLFVLVFTLTL